MNPHIGWGTPLTPWDFNLSADYATLDSTANSYNPASQRLPARARGNAMITQMPTSQLHSTVSEIHPSAGVSASSRQYSGDNPRYSPAPTSEIWTPEDLPRSTPSHRGTHASVYTQASSLQTSGPNKHQRSHTHVGQASGWPTQVAQLDHAHDHGHLTKGTQPTTTVPRSKCTYYHLSLHSQLRLARI